MAFGEGSVLSIVFSVAYAIAAFLPFLLRGAPPSSIDPLQPYPVISLLLFFYSLSTLRGFEVSGLAEALESVSPFSVVKFAIACIVGQIGLAVGELSGPHRMPGHIPAGDTPDATLKLRLLIGVGLPVALLALPFYFGRLDFINVASYSDSAFETRITRMADDAAGVREVLLQEVPSILLLCGCTALMLDPRRLPVIRLAAALIFGAYALTSLLAGLRGQLATMLLLPFLFFHYRRRRLSLSMAALIVLAGYVLMNALSISRLSSNPLEMIALLTEQIASDGYGFLDVGQSGELQTSTNLVRLIVGIDTGEDTYRWGAVTASNLASTIPRMLWAERPPTGSELFVQVFHPGVLEAGGGYGSFIFQDPYWDFGLAGVFVFAACLGWLMRKVYVGLVLDRGSSFAILVYAIIYGHLVVSVIRSGIFAGLKGALVSAAPLLVIAVIAALASSNERSTARLSG